MSRRRYVYRPNPETGEVESVEVTPDYQRHDERQPVFTDRYMEGVRAPDGTDIGCRWKRNEYMRREGVADLSDFTNTLKQTQERREAWRAGRAEVSRELVEEVGRAAYEARRRRK
jgi:hypothetical protein